MRVTGRGSRPEGRPGGRVVVFGVIALAFVSFVACGGGEVVERPAPAEPTIAVTSPTPDAAAPTGDPGVTVENVIQACREKDGARLRSFVAGPVSEEEIQALFERGTDVRLAGRTPPRIDGGRATVEVRLQRDGEKELVERTWELEQGDDGVWRFTTLPDCF